MAHVRIKTSNLAYSSFFTTDLTIGELIKTYLNIGKMNSTEVVAVVIEKEYKVNGVFNKIFD